MPRFRHILAALLALTAWAAAGPAGAQTITGIVVDDRTGARLPGVLLVLLDDRDANRGEAVSGDSGAFRIEVPGPGSFVLTGSLIGYGEVRSEPLLIGAREDLAVEIRMAVEAVPLEPLVVRSRSNGMDSQLGGFYTRMARGRRSGLGHFIDYEEVDRQAAVESTDLLRTTPGVRVIPGRAGYGAAVRMTGGCIPAIYVDGMQVNRPPLRNTSLDELVNPMSIEGIEIYRGAMSHVGSYHDPAGCGLILVWTRRGTRAEGLWSWKKFIAGMGLFGVMFFLIH